MRIVVCVRKDRGGELGAFDAAAYEEALRIEGAEVILLSMGPEADADYLLSLTRLGAARAVLLTDPSFAGADTLATAYTLSAALKKLSPDFVFAGRQTLIGDTAQTAPMIAAMLEIPVCSSVMELKQTDGGLIATTRAGDTRGAHLPCVLTFERTQKLRLPRLRSKLGALEKWCARDIDADPSRVGLVGSPTRVVKTFENESGKRRCKFIKREELDSVIALSLTKDLKEESTAPVLKKVENGAVICVTNEPFEFAKTLCDEPRVIFPKNVNELIFAINERKTEAVFFGSDTASKELAAQLAVKLSLGLCADLTRAEYDGEEIYMYRPALSGSIIAKIKSLTRPVLATVRTKQNTASDIVVAAGFGVKDELSRVMAFAEAHGASLASTRRMTDNSVTPYEWQVGLTGKSVSPKVYIAVGISGAVHHIAGMQKSGTVIAINPDRDAPIFDYADYGILEEF